MYPHERSLVEKFDSSLFVIVGVNSDTSRARLHKAMESNQLTWPSFFDGGLIGGPIATRFGVHGWPSLFLIDDMGVIQHCDRRDLDGAIDALVATARERKDK